MFTFLFLVMFAIFVGAQKLIASYLGYECKFKLWEFSPFIGLMIAFVSYGFIPFLYLGTVELKVVEHLRLGKFRQSINIRDLMITGIAGPLALLLFSLVVLMPIYFATHTEFIRQAVIVSTLIIFFTSLPLPNTNGINVLLHSRIGWAFYFVFGLILMLLIIPFNIFAYAVALVLALIIVFFLRKYIAEHA